MFSNVPSTLAVQRRVSKRRPGLYVSAIVVLIIAATAVLASKYSFISRAHSTEDPSSSSGQTVSTGVNAERVSQGRQAELVTIGPRGFEPSTISRPAGPILLIVRNLGEFPSRRLQLLRSDGTVLVETPMPRNRKRWSIPLDLPAGVFRVVDPEHSSVAFTLELTR